ncbi:hypothetical protein [Pedobacter sp. UBA5917]|jgi:hypothetical protein|uniref:hypothetical protein n=1 Tax=Pedobacter sp. UBA5917 TaxID=1947061 RepID=UPI0025DC15DC|nr:hypothetical protein [Pedobacter sp. UBA5917]
MSQQTATTEKTQCRYCEKELHGRTGKMFCNVDCKNNYNSRIRSVKRAEENKLFPEVIKTIKNNYRILLGYNLSRLTENEYITINKDELRSKGFDHRYCTGASIDTEQKLWKCCFTFCWHENEESLTFTHAPHLNSKNHFHQ